MANKHHPEFGPYCEHGVPRKFCTAAKHKRYPDENSIVVIGAAVLVIFVLIFILGAIAEALHH